LGKVEHVKVGGEHHVQVLCPVRLPSEHDAQGACDNGRSLSHALPVGGTLKEKYLAE
jgi:hypothetical protein